MTPEEFEDLRDYLTAPQAVTLVLVGRSLPQSAELIATTSHGLLAHGTPRSQPQYFPASQICTVSWSQRTEK